jgi:hypothetical protein
MERMKKEFGSGDWNTEEQLIDGLKRFKQAMKKDLRNIEAGYNPLAVEKYTKQGGLTSRAIEDFDKLQNMLKKDPKGPNAEKIRGGLRARGVPPLY